MEFRISAEDEAEDPDRERRVRPKGPQPGHRVQALDPDTGTLASCSRQ